MARAGFQVAFEGVSFCAVVKGDVGHNPPRGELGSVRRFAGVMFSQACTQIVCFADVTLQVHSGFEASRRNALYVEQPYFAKTTKGATLLRVRCHTPQGLPCEAH